MNQSHSKTYTLAILTALVIFGSIFWYVKKQGGNQAADFSRGDIVLNFKSSGAQEAEPVEADPSWQTYSSVSPSFMFRYPKEYSTGEFADAGGKTVLVQGNAKTLMQIFVAEFADAPYITIDAIRTDLPDLSVKEPQDIQVLGGSGLTFLSDNNLSEPTREIWFVRNGLMYQVSVPLGNEQMAANIIETMKFGN